MSGMRFAQGGVITPRPEGDAVMVAWITVDECLISREGVCVRTDLAHAEAPLPEDPKRFWRCPSHEGEQ